MSQTSQESSRPLPQRIGDYEILEEIGAGGMGTVYLGRQQETRQVAAVKLLPPALAREEGFRLRFTREILALQQLNSPHIVRFYASGEDLDSVFYAMEYVAGETLSEKLRASRKLPWRDAVDITLQLCLALKSAHDAGIVHRDLKPSNVLIDTDGTVKLSDFGIAQVFAADKLTMTGGVVGTAEYMSPEQATGQRANKRSDLYSLGALLYVMLTGRPPFTGPTAVDILQKHRYGQFDRPGRYAPEIPLDLDNLVVQLLEKEPDKRLPDAYVLSLRLQEILRKQDLKHSDQSPTVDAPAAPASRTDSASRSGPGEATLMSELMRAEIQRQSAPGGLQKLFDNVWVLAGLLAVVVGTVAWLLFGGPTEQQQFQAGVALMNEPAGPDWLRARDDYFQPLIDRNPAQWQPEVEKYLYDIETYALEQKLLVNRRLGRSRKPQLEVDRQLREIRTLWDDGHLAQALADLQAVQQLWKADETALPWLTIADRWSQALQAELQDQPDPREFLQQQLESARQAAANHPDDARKTLEAIRRLYGDDPRVGAIIESAAELEQSLKPDAPKP